MITAIQSGHRGPMRYTPNERFCISGDARGFTIHDHQTGTVLVTPLPGRGLTAAPLTNLQRGIQWAVGRFLPEGHVIDLSKVEAL